MTKSEDRWSLTVGNWLGLATFALTLLFALGAAYKGLADDVAAAKTDAAVTRTKVEQLSSDFGELKKALNDRR